MRRRSRRAAAAFSAELPSTLACALLRAACATDARAADAALASPKRSAARQVWHNVSNATADARGRAVDPYDFSILKGYNGFGNGHCDKPFDPACVCGSWRDVHHGVWSSYSYHCANASVLAGGWEVMDGGNGYYNGPILPLGLRYNTSAGSTIGDRAAR